MRPSIVLLAATVLFAAAAPARAGDEAPLERAVRVKGQKVNVRAGPSVNHHHLLRLSHDDLLVVVGEDEEWRRVRVPGGVPVFVHGDLVKRDEGALRGTITASDVLMRPTASRAYFALHDQHLQRGDEVLLLGEEQGEDALWVKLVPPERVHAWIHADYLEDLGPVSDHEKAVALAARKRVDVYTGGRTKKERDDARTLELLRYESARRDTARAIEAGAERRPDEVRTLLDDLAAIAPGDEYRRDVARMRAEFELAVTKRENTAALERARRAREDETKRRERLEEKTRVYEERIETLRSPGKPTLGAPDAEGALQRRRGRLFVVTNATHFLEVGSRRFRLADFVGKRVRIHGRTRTGGVLDVEHLEIISRR